eukprot:2675538-Pyramimonas_sp.AAC.1
MLPNPQNKPSHSSLRHPVEPVLYPSSAGSSPEVDHRLGETRLRRRADLEQVVAAVAGQKITSSPISF